MQITRNAIRIAMGPIKNVNLCIAPAFYSSQVYICGPFDAYSYLNKRAMIKIWFTGFCCRLQNNGRLFHGLFYIGIC